jgi:iron(III) transport system permease protein
MGLLSWIIYRSRLPGAGVLEYVVMFPQAVPRLVFAFGMMWAWLVFPIPIYGTLCLLAHRLPTFIGDDSPTPL